MRLALLTRHGLTRDSYQIPLKLMDSYWKLIREDFLEKHEIIKREVDKGLQLYCELDPKNPQDDDIRQAMVHFNLAIKHLFYLQNYFAEDAEHFHNEINDDEVN